MYYPLAASWNPTARCCDDCAGALAFASCSAAMGPDGALSSRKLCGRCAGDRALLGVPVRLGKRSPTLRSWRCSRAIAGVTVLLATRRGREPALVFLLLVRDPRLYRARAFATALVSNVDLGPPVFCGRASCEVVLWRLFPGGGRFPFSSPRPPWVFCVLPLGLCLTCGSSRACVALLRRAWYSLRTTSRRSHPSAIGENVPAACASQRSRSRASSARSQVADRSSGIIVLPAAFAVSVDVSRSQRLPLQDGSRLRRTQHLPERSGSFTTSSAPRITEWKRSITATHWPPLSREEDPVARGWFRQTTSRINEVLYSTLWAKSICSWLHGSA